MYAVLSFLEDNNVIDILISFHTCYLQHLYPPFIPVLTPKTADEV